MPLDTFSVKPIGVIRTPYGRKDEAPRQPGAYRERAAGTITLDAGANFEQALEDLAGFERIWVITWFHQVSGWKPKVQPPRGRKRRGLFATRSPHRPNPIGLSLCRLLSIEGRVLTVENPDLIDGTPVLDIKPYLPSVEAFPDSAAGWIGEIEAGDRPPFSVSFLPQAREQIDWLRGQGVDFEGRLQRVLSSDPRPHPYRRIKAAGDGTLVLSYRSWRVRFRTGQQTVTVTRVASGYGAAGLARAKAADEAIDGGTIHEAFLRRWPDEGTAED